jgi:hypothetical protein
MCGLLKPSASFKTDGTEAERMGRGRTAIRDKPYYPNSNIDNGYTPRRKSDLWITRRGGGRNVER